MTFLFFMGLIRLIGSYFFFFFNDTATTEIYTLSLHDALPIFPHGQLSDQLPPRIPRCLACRDRKSTRLNSSHGSISYAVFCLKKKKDRHALCRPGLHSPSRLRGDSAPSTVH